MALQAWKFGLLIICALYSLATICVADEAYSISQISPKSEGAQLHGETFLETSSNLDVDSLKFQTLMTEYDSKDTDTPELHTRVERSASPILNEIPPESSVAYDKLQHLSVDEATFDAAGRYYNYDINPTHIQSENAEFESSSVPTQSHRESKSIEMDSFLSKRGPRLESASGSPIMINNATLMESIVLANKTGFNRPRQTPNPDIQDIITGIVKLLNGNVNVHANTQTSRRPIPSRINNRGPPRISDSQQMPSEYDLLPSSSIRSPPYPFERPDGPIRPFLTGVPIPEQIVPSMQQNYRPGFVSQNRPPWQRPRPRPPITGNRRPYPYKPVTPAPEYHLEDEIQFTTIETDQDDLLENSTEAYNMDNNNYEIVEETEDVDHESADPVPPSKIYTPSIVKKKEDFSKKKDPNSNKVSEKKPIFPVLSSTTSSYIVPSTLEEVTITETTTVKSVTTIIESVSEVNTIDNNLSTHFENPIESSITEVAQSTLETTPLLESTAMSSSSSTSLSSTILLPSISSLIEPTTPKPLSTITNAQYHPRPGIVLDDPEFKPGGNRPAQVPPTRPRPAIQPTRPPGYGEIFDVTLSAIQGPGSGPGSKQTINIKPYGYNPTGSGQTDIIVSASGDDGFVSIDGKRTYINLFGEPTDEVAPSATAATQIQPTQVIPPGVTGTGYAIPETESPPPKIQRPHYRPRVPTQPPPVRIDTCIVGDDSTCDQTQNEKCKTDSGVSSCHCRPGYSRRKHREPCRKIVSIIMSLRVDKFYDRRIVWDQKLSDTESEPYSQLSYEALRAIDSAMSMTPYSDEYMKAKINRIYQGDASQGAAGVFVNLTLMLEENAETLRHTLKNDIQRHLLGVIHRRNNNIGNSALYVDSPPGSVSNLQDLDECVSNDLNDCHPEATCSNVWGSFRCECPLGLRDPWFDQPHRAGRECIACSESHCNNRGMCSYDGSGNQVCSCVGSYYGAQCEIDGEVLGVAIGASVIAVIIIVLTLICLVMWSRKWHREQKNAMGSPVFGYMSGTAVKTPQMGTAPYQLTLEDRMRWAQIADVMAQSNHYAAEPIGSTRPSSAVFGYPSLQAIGNMNTLANMSNLGTLSMHNSTLPPVPLPRLGLHTRANGMRTLENSSSSEEEDRTDLLGRNFHVPRPKSRSTGSIANQSGIYYDVDYEPSGGIEHLYGSAIQSNSITGPQGIPMSTYTSGKAPSYFMK